MLFLAVSMPHEADGLLKLTLDGPINAKDETDPNMTHSIITVDILQENTVSTIFM